MIFSKAVDYSRMIKIAHTIFALPFALAAVVLAYPEYPVKLSGLFWILVAMVSARSAAMGFNRIADAEIDAKNPRTSIREIPKGVISLKEAYAFVILSSAVFIFAAAMLSRLCFWLSFPVLCVFFFYSYSKRFTWLAHLILGLAIGMAPMGVWIAISGEASWKIGILSLALLTYIAGFDILYACQDIDFDKKEGLHSIPSKFGVCRAMRISTLLHIISVVCLASLYWQFALSSAYLVVVGIIALLFIVEHTLVNPDDLSRIDMAFFHVNSAISVLVFIAVLAGALLKGVI